MINVNNASVSRVSEPLSAGKSAGSVEPPNSAQLCMAPTSKLWAASISPVPPSKITAVVIAACKDPPDFGSASRAAAKSRDTSSRDPQPDMSAPMKAASANRRARSTAWGLSSAVRVSAATAPTTSPRPSFRSANHSNCSAARSSRPTAASARCQARSSGLSTHRLTSSWCAHRRSSAVESSTTTERMSGCLNVSLRVSLSHKGHLGVLCRPQVTNAGPVRVHRFGHTRFPGAVQCH